ncbi:25746_t:CDS:1, partial [Gigaspora margarita]
ENIWQLFLNRFFEVIDEKAIFMTEFKEAWQIFISKCLLKIIEEILNVEIRLVKITDLDSLTLDYDIYDVRDVLNPNDA